MLIPLRTDAPLHHRPWATCGVIAVNVAVQIWVQGAEPADVEGLILRYGAWAPWQWITSVFLHAGWFHLVGNMLFLWVFGLVVEGKIGWWRFLALYGAIAVAANAVEQTLMLGGDGGSVGASGVIFGLIGVAMVWAPENEVDCLFVFFPAVRHIDLSIRDLGLIYLAIEVLWMVLGGLRMSSSALHLIGAAAGVPIGVAMLKRGWVDCEGWDWFTRRDRHIVPIRDTSVRVPVAAARGTSAPVAAAPRVFTAAPDVAVQPPTLRFAVLMSNGDVDGALRLHSECTAAERSTLKLPVRERLIRALADADRSADARPVAAGVLLDDPGHPGAGLLEAEMLVRERRPSKADRVLAAIAGRLETEQQRRAHAGLVARAEELRAAGVLELDD